MNENKNDSKDISKDISSLSDISVVSRRAWMWLLFAGLICVAIGFWVFFGYIPVTIEGKGIIVSRSGLANIQAQIEGEVDRLSVRRGQVIKKGDPILTIEDPKLQLKFQAAESRVTIAQTELKQLQGQIEQEGKAMKAATEAKLAAAKFNVAQLEEQVDFLTREVNSHRALLEKGLISGVQFRTEEQMLIQKKIDLETKRSELNHILAEIKKEYRPEELRNKEQQLLTEKEQRDILQLSLNQSKVRSPYDGRILEIMVNNGDRVKPGSALIWLEKSPVDKPIIYSYFPIESGKKISQQTEVEMRVPEVNHNVYGNILGHVVSVSQYAVSKENIYNKIQNKTIADNLIGSNAASVEIIIDPEEDDGHFKWTSGQSPPQTVSTGTLVIVEATVEKVRPIYYLLPLPIFKENKL